MAVSPSALSGFRLRPPVGALQEDSLKPTVFVLVSTTVGALEPRSASFPGIEVSGWMTRPDALALRTRRPGRRPRPRAGLPSGL